MYCIICMFILFTCGSIEWYGRSIEHFAAMAKQGDRFEGKKEVLLFFVGTV